ncbi:MAG: reverse transcriptase domain-containing protein [Desulfuromonadales bacterium]
MKRTGKLFDAAFTEENLYQAYLDARKGKRRKKACFEFETNLGANLTKLRQAILSGTYRPDPYFQFKIYEPKERIIHAPSFKDIVVQHAIYRMIYPIFDRTFIDASFACRKGKGTHMARDYTQLALRKYDGENYTLKLDIRKFFYSIDRGILRQLIECKIKDVRFVGIMMMFAEHEQPTGIPIGNLLSQIYALIYMNPVDQFVKRELKIRHYCRYVDDFVLFGLTRDQCQQHLASIVIFIRDYLRLTLSKFTIQKIRRGINFVGYRTWRSRIVIRKHSLFKFKRRCEKADQAAVISILGHAKRTNSLPRLISIIKEAIRNGKNLFLPDSYRRIYEPQSQRAALCSG